MPKINKQNAENIAISGLQRLAQDDELLMRFCNLTGILANEIREAAQNPDFLVGVLDFFIAYEPDLIAWAEDEGISPENNRPSATTSLSSHRSGIPMNSNSPDHETELQLRALGYFEGSIKHERPLLICDVDEVVLHLVTPFEKVLLERGYELKSRSFKLTGNIFEIKTGREATKTDVWAGLAQLFEEQAQRQQIVEGVVDALSTLSQSTDIVFLTNMPHEFGDIRREYLSQNGLDFPLVTNTDTKVPAIQIMRQTCAHNVGFIDDTPKNLENVKEGLPDIQLFHFVANERFRHLAGHIDGIKISSSDWTEAQPAIQNALHRQI